MSRNWIYTVSTYPYASHTQTPDLEGTACPLEFWATLPFPRPTMFDRKMYGCPSIFVRITNHNPWKSKPKKIASFVVSQSFNFTDRSAWNFHRLPITKIPRKRSLLQLTSINQECNPHPPSVTGHPIPSGILNMRNWGSSSTTAQITTDDSSIAKKTGLTKIAHRKQVHIRFDSTVHGPASFCTQTHPSLVGARRCRLAVKLGQKERWIVQYLVPALDKLYKDHPKRTHLATTLHGRTSLAIAIIYKWHTTCPPAFSYPRNPDLPLLSQQSQWHIPVMALPLQVFPQNNTVCYIYPTDYIFQRLLFTPNEYFPTNT